MDLQVSVLRPPSPPLQGSRVVFPSPCLASFTPRVLLICRLLITAVLRFSPRRSASSCPPLFFFIPHPSFFFSPLTCPRLLLLLHSHPPSLHPFGPPPPLLPTSALSKLSLLCRGHAGDLSPSAPAAPPLKVTSPSRLCCRFAGGGPSISGIRPTHPPPLLSHPALPLLCLFFRVCVRVCVTKRGRFPQERSPPQKKTNKYR